MTEDDRRSEENAYLAPALKFDEAAHEQLMAEARQMDSVLKGEQVNMHPAFFSFQQSTAVATALFVILFVVPA